jgi:hypothetical protein
MLACYCSSARSSWHTYMAYWYADDLHNDLFEDAWMEKGAISKNTNWGETVSSQQTPQHKQYIHFNATARWVHEGMNDIKIHSLLLLVVLERLELHLEARLVHGMGLGTRDALVVVQVAHDFFALATEHSVLLSCQGRLPVSG